MNLIEAIHDCNDNAFKVLLKKTKMPIEMIIEICYICGYKYGINYFINNNNNKNINNK